MKIILMISMTALFVFQAQAEVIKGQPIKVEIGIPGWNTNFKSRMNARKKAHTYPSVGVTECREVQEIPGAHLCLSFNQTDMNLALGRTSIFVEGSGGEKKGVVVAQNNKTFNSLLDDIGGHDLKGPDLMAFYQAATNLNDQERELYENYLVPEITKNPNLVVITYAINSMMDYENILSHEILHAQYFLNPEFKKVADQFWDTRVTESDKRAIRHIFSQNYDPKDELLMKNEFQAYILQFDAGNAWMKDYVAKYRGGLIADLSAKGLRPISVN